MLNDEVRYDIDRSIYMLYDILPDYIRNERPWLNDLDRDILFILAIRHLLKTGTIFERHALFQTLAHHRLKLSEKQAALEEKIYFVDQYRFRQQKAMTGLQTYFPSLYEWLKEATVVSVILWHTNDPVFRRVTP